MGRLQALEQLTLNLSASLHVSWQDCIQLLQSIPLSVRKLSLGFLWLAKPLPPIEVLAEELVAKLEDFVEVDFRFRGFLHDNDRDITHAMSRRFAAVGSSGEGLKLKVLAEGLDSIFEPYSFANALPEERKVLTVNIFQPFIFIDFYEVKDEDEDEEDGILDILDYV